MGTSNWQNISYCCEIIHRISPRRVLDVGVGTTGRWGLLVREFADIWGGRVLPHRWETVIDGIEAHEPNIQPYFDAWYDHIFIGDAYEVIVPLDYYDLIILGDVIEHFEPERAVSMLRRCVDRGVYVLVNTPLGDLDVWTQGEVDGNRWERHQKIFTKAELLKSPFWRVREHRVFRDYINRRFGTFLLREARRPLSSLKPGR